MVAPSLWSLRPPQEHVAALDADTDAVRTVLSLAPRGHRLHWLEQMRPVAPIPARLAALETEVAHDVVFAPVGAVVREAHVHGHGERVGDQERDIASERLE